MTAFVGQFNLQKADISQGSVVTCFRGGGIFLANLLLNVHVPAKKFKNLVNNYQRYGQKSARVFFDSLCGCWVILQTETEILCWNENYNWHPSAAAFHSGRTLRTRCSCQNLRSRCRCQNCRRTEGLCWWSWRTRDVSDCRRPCCQRDTHTPRHPLHQTQPSCLDPRPTPWHQINMTTNNTRRQAAKLNN